MILAGDIGGTKTRLALFKESGRELVMSSEAVRFVNREALNFLSIVQKFLAGHPKGVSRACFGIAGPVQDGRCRLTNLPWVVDEKELQRELKMETVKLINDLEATGWGLGVLKPEDTYLLQTGTRQNGNVALIAAGTGLGEAGLYWNGKEHLPFACEGGHTDFGPRNALEIELFLYMKKIYPSHVSYERLISGPGLQHFYRFLIDTRRGVMTSEVQQEMKHRDPSRVISEWGCENRDPVCKQAVEWFVSLYGAEAGNLALKYLSRGGVYVGGGIAPHLLGKIKEGGFLKGFLDKGRFRAILEAMPVHIVLNEETALLGAAEYARRH